jgi:hypothetical protein
MTSTFGGVGGAIAGCSCLHRSKKENHMKAREIAKKIAHNRSFAQPITTEELEPHMEGENVSPGRLQKAQTALDALGTSMSTKWKLDGGAKKKKR